MQRDNRRMVVSSASRSSAYAGYRFPADVRAYYLDQAQSLAFEFSQHAPFGLRIPRSSLLTALGPFQHPCAFPLFVPEISTCQ